MHIHPVNSAGQLKTFIDFPHSLYQDAPHYVPELYKSMQDLFNTKTNPLFAHSSLQCFLAEKDGEIVGRIAAIHNSRHNEFTDAKDGFFGFFDCIDDQEIANALLDSASQWLINKGCKQMIGPTNPTTNDPLGVLMKGYDKPPYLLMTYNYPYYSRLLDKYGLEKYKDLISYELRKGELNTKSLQLAGRLEERLKTKGVIIRKANLKKIKEEIKMLMVVYNGAWEKNWGFIPPTEAEVTHLAKELKLILDEDFVYFAEKDGEPIGFALALPNYNQIFKSFRKGRLFPFNVVKLFTQKKKINQLRILALGVLEPYRRMGIEGIFYAKIIQRGIEKGFVAAEAGWILEDNEMMNKGLINLKADPYKRYRLYGKAL